MKTIKLIVLIGFWTFMSSCEKENITPDVIEIPMGQEFTLELESNWSTGYHWQWVNEDEISVVDPKGITYQSEDTLLGSLGKEKWMFETILKGEELLRFEYRSPVRTDTAVLVNKEILINVY